MASRAEQQVVGEEEGKELTRGHKKKARTRQHLVDTALRLFALGEGDELSLNRLADEAGLSHGTVYNHFRTRDDLLEAAGLMLAEQFSHQVIELSTGLTSGAERLAIGVRSFVLKAQADRDWGRALVKVVRYADGLRTTLASYVRADLQAGVKQEDFRYPSEEMAIVMVVAGVAGAIAAQLEGHAVARHDSAAAEMVLLALGVPSERAAYLASLPMPASFSGVSEG